MSEEIERLGPTYGIVYRSPNAYKIYTREYRDYRRRWNNATEELAPFPVHLDIELNTTCNLRCIMCPQSFDNPGNCTPKKEDVLRCLREGSMKGSKSVKFNYRGEPLLVGNLMEFVAYAKGLGYVDVSINTNGTLMDADFRAALMWHAERKIGLDSITISIDSPDEETYEKIRRGGKLKYVVHNIRRLMSLKRGHRVNKPIVRITFVDMPENHGELNEFKNFWRNPGRCDEVGVGVCLDLESHEEEGRALPLFTCSQLWQRLIILADGDVLPCCRGTLGFNEKLNVIGNIHDNTLEEIWNSPILEGMRGLHKRHESHEIKMCRLCGYRKWLCQQKYRLRSPSNWTDFPHGNPNISCK